jgi:hypothetical protein
LPDADLLRDLIAAGVDASLIGRVALLIAELQTEHQAKDELAKRRVRNTERMRAVRARARTQTHNPPQHISTSPPKNEPKKVRSIDPDVRGHPRTNTTFPENWFPKAFDLIVDQAMFEGMKDYCLAHNRTYVDWEAAARQWKRNQPKFEHGNRSNLNGKRAGSVLDACDQLIDQLGGIEAANQYIPGSSGPKPLELDRKPSTNGPKLISSR